MKNNVSLPGFVAINALISSDKSKCYLSDLNQEGTLDDLIAPQVSVCTDCFHVTGAGHKCFNVLGHNLCFNVLKDGWYKVCEIPWLFPPHLQFEIIGCSPPY